MLTSPALLIGIVSFIKISGRHFELIKIKFFSKCVYISTCNNALFCTKFIESIQHKIDRPLMIDPIIRIIHYKLSNTISKSYL